MSFRWFRFLIQSGQLTLADIEAGFRNPDVELSPGWPIQSRFFGHFLAFGRSQTRMRQSKFSNLLIV